MAKEDPILKISSLDYLNDHTEKKQTATDTISLVFLSLYLLIPFISNQKYQDFYGLHWFLISILNGIVGLYLLFHKDHIVEQNLPHFLKSKIYLIYIAFTIISGISIIGALNLTESFVQYSRLINIVISFTLLGLLFVNRKHLFTQIAIVITAITFLEGFFVVQDFYKGAKTKELSPLILETLKWTTGNKNIFTITMVLKIPFLIYLFVKKSGFWKYFALVTLFIATHVVYLSVTRTAFAGMILVFATYFIGSFFVKKINGKSSIIQVGITILVFVASCFLGQNKIDDISSKSQNIDVNTPQTEQKSKAQVLAKLEDSEGDVRFKYWKGASEIIKENPILGVGYGNFKLYTPTYSKYLLGDGTFSKHPHNDFIFVAGESGLLACILYISLFLVAIFILLKSIFTSKDANKKLISLTLLTSIGICMLDALFNFPKERPVTQILLILLFILVIICNLKDKENNETTDSNTFKSSKIVAITTLILSSIIIYTNNVILDSMIIQGLADTDYYTNLPAGKPLQNKHDDIKKLMPTYPNISELYEPVDAKLAKFLRAEKRYDEAIATLKATERFHPNFSERNFTIAMIFYHDLKMNDSAYVYITKALKDKPRSYEALKLAGYLTANKTDYKKILEIYKNYYSLNDENEENYAFYCQLLYTAKCPNDVLYDKVKIGLKKYPSNQEIMKLAVYLDLTMLK